MFERLKLLAAKWRGRLPPFAGPPSDPYAQVREPRKRGPGGRHSAVAVLAPEPDQFINANGRARRRPLH